MKRAIISLLLITIISATYIDMPLYGKFDELFMYYTIIEVGEPALNFTVVVDTGSSNLLIPDINCVNCYGGDPKFYYDGDKSKTSTRVKCDQVVCKGCRDEQCTTEIDYVGISEFAYVWTDNVDFDGIKTNAYFGAIYNVSFGRNIESLKRKRHLNGLSMDYPEGMMGMAYKGLNTIGTPTVFDSLVGSSGIEDIFSICLRDEGGIMRLGGIGPWSGIPPIFTPIIEELYYGIHMDDVKVGGVSIGVNSKIYNQKYCIVDTGTVMPTLPEQAYDALKSTVENLCAFKHLKGVCDVPSNATLFDQKCFSYTQEELAQFPTIQFVLKGDVKIDYPPSLYLRSQYFCEVPGTLGLGMDKDKAFTVLGAELLKGYNTIYDRKNQRIGFSPMTICA